MADYHNSMRRRRQQKLQQAETKFNNMLNDIQRGYANTTRMNKEDVKNATRIAFDQMRDTTLNVIEDNWSNSEISNTSSVGPEPFSQEMDIINNSVRPQKNTNCGLVVANSGHATPEISYGTSFPHTASLQSCSFQTYSSSSSWSTTGGYAPGSGYMIPPAQPAQIPQAMTSTQPSPDVVPATSSQPVTADHSLVGDVLAMLERIGQKVVGFFQWLKTKIMQVVTAVWNGVCKCFNSMFSLLRNAWYYVTGCSPPQAS